MQINLSIGPKRYRSVVAHRCLGSLLPLMFGVGLFGFSAAHWTGRPQHLVAMADAESHDSKAAGAALFHEKGCEHCHGVNGRGGELGPDLSGVGRRKNKAEIEHQIQAGGGGMPAFGEALQPEEIKNLVEYLHAKREAQKQPPPAPSLPAS